MLITDNKLNIEEFKQIVPTLTWLKLPRNLNTDNKEYFYQGKFEDSEKIIKVIIRPSLWMSVSESFKNRHPMDGSIPSETYKGNLVEWGYYTEVNIDTSFLNKIKELAKSPEAKQQQTVSW